MDKSNKGVVWTIVAIIALVAVIWIIWTWIDDAGEETDVIETPNTNIQEEQLTPELDNGTNTP